MRIVHVCQFLGMGGLEKVLLSLAKEQMALGHQVKVLVYDHERRWVEKFRAEGVQVEDDYRKAFGFDWNLISWLEEKTKGWDVVHTHDLNPALYAIFARARLKLRANKKPAFIHTTHGMEHLDTTPKTRLYERALPLGMQKIVSVSPQFAAHYQSMGRMGRLKAAFIPNGVAAPAPAATKTKEKRKNEICAKYDLKPSEPLGIYVGRIGPLKNQLELIERYKQSGRQLLLAGPATDADYMRQCLISAKDSAVKLIGPVEDVAWLLSGCDYFISSSKHEGMPIAPLEAGANLLPCVLSDIPGHRLFNLDAPNVFLFSNAEELNASLRLLPELGAQKAKRFYERILAEYSSAAMARKYCALYAEFAC